MKNPQCAISPAIIAKSRKSLIEKIRLAETFPGHPCVQLDIMDGKFVRNTTVSVRELKDLPTRLPYELHLMINNPEKELREILKTRAVRAIFHYESTEHLDELFANMKKGTMTSALALNPKTPIRVVKPYLHLIDSVLLLSVEPGSYGAPFRPSVYQRIRALRKLAPKLSIAVDGGISLDNAKKLIACGATRLAIGSRIFQTPDPRAAYAAFRKLIL